MPSHPSVMVVARDFVAVDTKVRALRQTSAALTKRRRELKVKLEEVMTVGSVVEVGDGVSVLCKRSRTKTPVRVEVVAECLGKFMSRQPPPDLLSVDGQTEAATFVFENRPVDESKRVSVKRPRKPRGAPTA